MISKQPITIGRAELIDFPELHFTAVPARIDTGAKTSAIWVSAAQREGDMLRVVFFGEGSPFYTGEPVLFDTFETAVVASSNGIAQQRYKVSVLVMLAGRKIRASFTLADRSSQAYPVLIGRNVLRGKFIVDVTQGVALRAAEKQRALKLQSTIEKSENEENT
jgi:hypothetical protein